MDLRSLGWNSFFEENFEEYKAQGLIPARVSSEQKNLYYLLTENGEKKATLSDKLWYNAFSKAELPAVGDWVALKEIKDAENESIIAVLPRKSKFSRKAKDSFGRNYNKPGNSDEQIISANIDTVFLVSALGRDFNPRKIERYLTIIWDSGANPVIVLNKADQCPDYEEVVEEVESIAFGIPTFAVSAAEGFGMHNLSSYIEPGKTITLIGSSGVGKSTIINYLIGLDKQKVIEVRSGDHRGRHTTTHREMIMFPGGGILIDNPGIRDVKIIGTQENLNQTFEDIVILQSQCRFRNCRHDTEPDCAIKNAIEQGDLTIERYENYLKLKREMKHLEKRQKQREHYLEKARMKQSKFGIKLKKHGKTSDKKLKRTVTS